MFGVLDPPFAGSRDGVRVADECSAELLDPERYLWPEDLDPSDPAITDARLLGDIDAGNAGDALDGSLFEDVAPGAGLALRCAAAAGMAAHLSDAELLEVIEGFERMRRWADGQRTRLVATYADRHPAGSSAPPPGATVASPVTRWVPDELGMTLHVSRLEAQSLIAGAQRLAHVLPDTLDALQAGRIDERRAETISFATSALPDEKARTVEATVLAKADGATHRQVYDRTRRAVHRVDPDGEYRRHHKARQDRRVTLTPRDEGMAAMWAYGPAADCEATFTMLTRLAHSLGAGDPRNLDQRRFDLLNQVVQGRITVTDLADLDAILVAAQTRPENSSDTDAGTAQQVCTDAGGRADAEGHADGGDADCDGYGCAGSDGGLSARGCGDRQDASERDDLLVAVAAAALARQPHASDTVRKPLIQVVVGLDTLLGSDRPAELVGHGPIPAVTARALAAGGTWQRLVVHPLSGSLLDCGRTTYAPPAALADFVRARDQMCRGPGCTRRVRDLDHRIRWDCDGDTTEENLDGYCRSHHVLKELDGWSVLPHADGGLTWISPAGRRQTTDPYDYRPFVDDLPVGDPVVVVGDLDLDDRGGDEPPF